MDEKLNLSPLDPETDPDRFERLVASAVSAAVEARIHREPVSVTVLDLTRWARPLLAAAAVIALTATGALLALPSNPSQPESLAESAGIPPSIAHWAERGERPTAGDLVAAFGRHRW